MTPAYDKVLLPRAMDSLGRMLDYSVHSLHIEADVMMDIFAASDAASDYGRGDIRLIAGMSGIELAYEVLGSCGVNYERIAARHTSGVSSEYCCAGSLAYTQWKTCASFETVCRVLTPGDLISEFSRRKAAALAELPIDADSITRAAALSCLSEIFADETAELFVNEQKSRQHSEDAALKKYRIKNGLSQRMLAEASGVPLRTIQQYEQRQKDINRARSEYLIMLSSVLNCSPQDLLELFI